MIVYKIRHKQTGEFLNKNGYKSPRGGRVYTNKGHIKTGVGGYARLKNDEEYEVVEFELVEKGVIPITTL
jgi:hypothetical protein